MSSGVSQIKYWLGPKQTPTEKNSLGDAGGTYLSYDVFLGLSVLGGYLALDHLYLRSPLTFLAKLIVNIMFFGVWWLYDASQAIFNRDVVKVFGLSTPVLGPQGIASGVLANDKPDAKHMRFFYYALAVTFGGLFGMDSFLVGDTTNGIIRVVCLITLIFAPIALIWWLYKLFKFFFNTKSVTDTYFQFFGAPAPMTLMNHLTGGIENFFGSTIGEIVGAVVKPVTNTVQLGIQTVDDGISTVKEGIALGKNALNRTTGLAEEVVGTASQAFSLIPKVTQLSEKITPPGVQSALETIQSAQQQGGAQSTSNTLGYVLMGTLGLIAASGVGLTFRRSTQSKKNGTKSRDDAPPPVPGVL